jgi:hypothetical protein
MSEPELEDFLILRNLDEPLPEETFEVAAKRAMQIIENLADEGVGIRWMKSHVRTQSDGLITGTVCHYRAENESAIHEHGDRAGLPVTLVDRLGETLENQ